MKLKYLLIIFVLFSSNVYTQVFGDTVQVRFTEWMDTTGFNSPDNFVWDNGLVTLAVYLADTAMAILTVSEPIINVVYTVEVFNVYDLAGNLVNPERDTTWRKWSAVPVELGAFTYILDNNVITLDWMTHTEVNNYGFYIQRNEEDIGFAEGHGNSNSPKYYSFKDTIFIKGTWRYRLKQVDNDGTFEYSKTLIVHSMGTQTFAIYPNPTRFNFKIIINDINKNKTVRIYTILGELVKTFITDEQTIYVNERLSTGVYLVIYHNKEENTTNIIKLMILK